MTSENPEYIPLTARAADEEDASGKSRKSLHEFRFANKYTVSLQAANRVTELRVELLRLLRVWNVWLLGPLSMQKSGG